MPTPNTLTWNPDPSATSFNVYRGNSLVTVVDNSTPYASGIVGDTYVDTGVVAGAQYFYQISGVSAGVESARSPVIESDPVPFPVTPVSPEFIGLDNFAVLAATTITNTGATTILGDIGVSPGTSITGFPPGTLSGVLHTGDYVSSAGESTARLLYNALAAYPTSTVVSGDLGGRTLGPGVYTSTSTLGITGLLTLDAGGNPNAVFIFQLGSALTTAASNSTVIMINGGNPGNVLWQVGSSATLGVNTTFVGTIVASASISCGAGASIAGRLLALSGAITLDSNSIVLFDASPFVVYLTGTAYPIGVVIFDCGSGLFWQVTTAGTTGATRPVFPDTPGAFVTDGTVVWYAVSPLGIFIQLPLPPGPPNVPPPPPAVPTGLVITV
jgi:hypothetical protein